MAYLVIKNRFQSLINKNANWVREINPLVFGKKEGFTAKLFGCWHNDLSRPFVQGKTAYRSCLECGARRQFNSETLETHGSFYFPPIIKSITE